MKQRWMVAAKRADFNAIAAKFGIDPVIARLIRNRDVIGDEAIDKYLNGTLKDLYAPELMKDMKKGAELILFHIRREDKIRIIGDYDIDGIMSSYILQKGFTRLGARSSVRIPDRIRDGYGLNENLVREAKEDGAQLIVTCDNGIAAMDQIRLAKDLGMNVVITDHHEIPYEEQEKSDCSDSLRDQSSLNGTAAEQSGAEGFSVNRKTANRRVYRIPPADAVINPKQADCLYPFKGLCGAVVAFKLICYLYDLTGIPAGEKEEFLEFAAFATIGDVMDLQDENRVIVKEGLKRLRRTSNPGMKELILQNSLDPAAIDTYHVGFVLGPCMNASGRLNTAEHALKMLLAESKEEAARLAGDLKALNESRKEMTCRGEEDAISMVESTSLMNDRVLVVYMPEVHESLAGIIAGRLKEHFGKPSFVLTRTENGVKGSGRSIEAYSMYEELCKCKDLLTKFGGHPMAAGLSLEEKNVPVFRKKLNEYCTLTEKDLVQKIVIDIPMPISYISRGLLDQMDLLKPFGRGNDKPIFAQKNIRIMSPRIFGKNRNVVKMRVVDGNGFSMDGVFFGDAQTFVDYCASRRSISIVYYPTINRYMGRENLQINIAGYQ